MHRERTYQDFLLNYAALEDKKRQVLVKIAEAQKTLVVYIIGPLGIDSSFMLLPFLRRCPSENTRRR